MRRQPTDDELLTSGDPEDFGVFYARHLSAIEGYFARRVDRETASDLAAETFAAALVARKRFLPSETPAVGWLYTIAARRLVDFQRRAIIRQRALDAFAANAAVIDRSARETRGHGRAHGRPAASPAARATPRDRSAPARRPPLHRARQRLRHLRSHDPPARLPRPGHAARSAPCLSRRAGDRRSRPHLPIRRRPPQTAAGTRPARAARLLIVGEPHPAAGWPVRAGTGLAVGPLRRELGPAGRGPLPHAVGERRARLARVQARLRPRRALRSDTATVTPEQRLAHLRERAYTRLPSPPLARLLIWTREADSRRPPRDIRA